MIKALVKMYRTVSTKKFATTMEVDRSTILRHLSEFDKVTKMYQWIGIHQWMVDTEYAKTVNVCSSLLNRFYRKPFFC